MSFWHVPLLLLFAIDVHYIIFHGRPTEAATPPSLDNPETRGDRVPPRFRRRCAIDRRRRRRRCPRRRRRHRCRARKRGRRPCAPRWRWRRCTRAERRRSAWRRGVLSGGRRLARREEGRCSLTDRIAWSRGEGTERESVNQTPRETRQRSRGPHVREYEQKGIKEDLSQPDHAWSKLDVMMSF